MSIAPLKWTYETKVSPAPETALEDYTTFHTIFLKDCEWNATKLRRILGGIKSTQFTLSDVSEEFVKRIVGRLNDAMKTQRHEFLWGLANMHSKGELYGDDDE